MAQKAWSIGVTGEEVAIAYPSGLTQTMPLKQAKLFFENGLAVCTNGSAVATAPSGKKGTKSAKKPKAMKGAKSS